MKNSESWQKSSERIQLEAEIDRVHNDSLDVAVQMAQDEFCGDLYTALSDESFVSRMQNKLKQFWQIYRQAYRMLEDLEKKEGYPATTAYVKVLDEISEYLPNDTKRLCHYLFSGVDIYWARIFKRVICEDINFDRDEMPNMWWDSETYGSERRQQIIATLKAQRFIPESAILEFIARDSEVPNNGDKQFNDSTTTLLVKGGSNFLQDIQSRFGNPPLEYGAIITVTAENPLEDIETRLKTDGYSRRTSLVGTDYLTPYATKLKDIHIFLR